MTPPIVPTGPFDLARQTRALGGELDAASAGSEWTSFLARRKELLDTMLQAAAPTPPPPSPLDQQGQPTTSLVPVQPGSTTQKPSPELIGQAHFWDIANPEGMSAAELQHQIDQRRLEVPRDQRTSLASALFAGGAAAAASAGAAAELTSHAYQNVAGAISDIPWIGTTLASILRADQAKLYLQKLQSQSAEAVEAANAEQPASDRTAFQFLTGAGKMAGYALPAIAAWEGLGAASGFSRLSWLAQSGTPLIRMAAKGALTSALLTDPDAPIQDKLMDLGLGAIMGGSQIWGRAGAAVALGGIGAGVGAAIGDTPAERRQHMIELGIGGALLPALAPTIAQALTKIRGAFPDGSIPVEPGLGGPGTEPVDADWHFVDSDKPQVSGNPVPQKLLAAGPGATATPTSADDLMAMFHADTPQRLDASGVPTPVEAQTPATVTSAAEVAAPELRSVVDGPAHLLGSKVSAADGTPLRVYHGTGLDFAEFDPSHLDNEALYGPGIYHTEDPSVAGGYSGLVEPRWNPDGPAQATTALQSLPDALKEMPEFNAAVTSTQSGIPDQQSFNALGIDLSQFATVPQPSIRPAYLDIKNPLDIDKTYTPQESHAIVDQLQQVMPEYNWNSVHDVIDGGGIAPGQPVKTGEDLYMAMSRAYLAEPAQGPARDIGGLEIPPTQTIQKSGLNYVLKQIGYDGITHIGGLPGGHQPHRVWIALDPAQVHPAYMQQPLTQATAQGAAEAITKQATVIESQTLPQTLGKVEVTDADVVTASKAAAPGGTAIVRGVGRPLDVMSEHPDVTFVEREGKLDALVGHFTPDMISDYKRFGTYEGNTVITASGIEGEVMGISGKGLVTIKRVGGGPPLRVRAENVLPSRFGDPVYEGKDLWPSFKADLLAYVDRESAKSGMAPAESLWDPRVTSQMQTHLDDYLTRRGILDPGTRHAIDIAINNSFVEEARDLDPESRDLQGRLGDEATVEANAVEGGSEPIAVSLEEKAEPRGFMWLSRPGADGGTLRDLINPEGAFEIPIETDAAAEEFLRSVDRSAPDITPASDVPFEVMESAPVGAQWEPRTGAEEEAENLADDVDSGDAELAGIDAAAGGAGGPPEPPSAPPASGFNEGPYLNPGEAETLGGQFARLRYENPGKWAALERKWSGNNFRYTRYLMASIENSMQNLGLDLARPWRDVAELEDARTKADNEAYDWHKESGTIFRKFDPALMRSGFVTRTMEIGSAPARAARWQGLKGYSKAEITKMQAAEAELTDFYNRLLSSHSGAQLSYDQARQFFRYISTVRMRQAQGLTDDKLWDANNILSPELQFFADHARANNLQFRVSDIRQITNHLVKSLMFAKYQAAPYRNLVNTWSDRRIPETFRSLMLDHAYTMRFGYKPENTMAVKAIRGVVERMTGAPVSTEEASRLAGLLPGWMYRSMLAGRTSLFFRDATQPLMALTKVHSRFMADAYGSVLSYWRKGEGRDQLMADYATALKHGWITRGAPAMEAATAFEHEPGSNEELLALTPEQIARRETLAKAGDVLLPYWLRRANDLTNTLKYYGKEHELNQFIVGSAAYRQAKVGLGEYRNLETQAALRGDPSLAMRYSDFARKSFFSSFQPAVSQHLQELVEAGNDEEAAATFAREVSKWSQFIYNTREKPKPLRHRYGRLASFFGNFTGQFAEGLNAAARYGEPSHRARALMVIGGFSYAMYKLGEQLGLRNLSNWAWTSSLKYAGSPLLELAAQTVLGYGGMMASADERNPSALQNEAMKDIPGLTDVGLEFFPYTGYLRSQEAIQEAAQGPSPARDIAQYLTTGDRGSKIQFLLDSRARAADFQQRYDPITNTLRPRPVGSLSPNGGTVHQPAPAVPAPLPNKHPGSGAQQ